MKDGKRREWSKHYMRNYMRDYRKKYPAKIQAWRKWSSDLMRFGGNREKAIQRHGEKCMDCQMTRTQHYQRYGCDLSVDHIDGQGRYSATKNHALENLRTYCLKCHGYKDVERYRSGVEMIDRRRDIMIRYFRDQGSYATIAKEIGRSPTTVRRIIWCCDAWRTTDAV